MQDEQIKQVIKGYQLEEMIGKGGFGAVYRARQAVVDREVAIKIILPKYANEPSFIRRFEAEAQLVARLEHLHIVPLYDYWRDPEGAYLVMRWLRGGSLKESMRKERWDIKPIIRLVNQISAALHTAHQAGVVHRDIKPANIFLDEADNAYLGDFGIAREQAVTTDPEPQKLVLSPAYVAPEMVTEDLITPQADIYSLGIVLYELLTGTHPYESRKTPLAMLRAQIYDPLPSVRELRPDLPEEMDDVLARATAKKPEERYPDVLVLDRAFRRALKAETRPIDLDAIRDSITFPDMEQESPLAALLEPENPYRGLRAFQQADSLYFFGRETLTNQLLERLEADRFIALVGPSGSGKSSVIRAGLIPALRKNGLPGSEKWFFVEVMPGAHPMVELEAGLLSIAQNQLPGSLLEQLSTDTRGLLRAVSRVLPEGEEGELFLFIDQFEEVFTLVKDTVERTVFLQSLVSAVSDPTSRLRLVITLRADFYDRPLYHPTFGDLMRRSTEVVLPLTPEELERAIVAPLQKVGVQIEAGLVAAIVAEVNQEPGALPLLQYALTELFDRRQNNVLTDASYHDIGGVLGALAGRAEEIYGQLTPDGRAAARQLFLRLVTLGEGMEDTRRRAPLVELLSIIGDPRLVQSVIEAFGKYRLLTFDSDPTTRTATVEVAHEALLRGWSRLREWLETSREDIRQQRKLATLFAEWQAASHEKSFLLRGARLEEFERWAGGTGLSLTLDERAFLGASFRLREQDMKTQSDREARESALMHQSRDRLRVLAGVMAVALIVAALLSIFAFRQRGTAENERDRVQQARVDAENARATSDANILMIATQAAVAQQRADEVQSLSLVGNAQRALLEHDSDLALTLALAAVQMENPPAQAVRFLNDLSQSPGTRRYFEVEGTVWRALPLGSDVITSQGSLPGAREGHPAVLHLWDVDSGAEIRRFGDDGDALALGLALTPDGTRLLSIGVDGTFHLWDVASGQEIAQYEIEEGELLAALDIGADGEPLLASFADGLLEISPDGRRFLSASLDGVLRLRDLETGEILQRMAGNIGAVTALAFDPNNSNRALAGYAAGRLRLWDLESGEMIDRYERAGGPINVLAISPDGEYFLYNGAGGDLNYANLESAEVIFTLSEHSEPVTALAFDPNGTTALSGGVDGRVILWDLASGTVRYSFESHGAPLTDVAITPSGALTTDSAGEIRLWDLTGGVRELRSAPVEGGAFAVAVSPDGLSVVTGTGSRLAGENPAFTGLILWDAASGGEIRRFEGHTDEVVSAEFNPDGTRLVSTSRDGSLRVWDVESDEELWQVDDHTEAFYRAAFSPNGLWIAAGGYQNTVRLWDAETGELIRSFEAEDGHKGAVIAVAFSPDGSRLLTGSRDQSLNLWDFEAGTILERLVGHQGAVSSAAFSGDGTLALSASFDGTLILWDLETQTVRTQLEGHSAEVMRGIFNADSTRVLSVGFDGTALLWSVSEGQVLQRLSPDDGEMLDAAFAPGMPIIYTTTSRLHQWQLPPERDLDDLVSWVQENRYLRDLTCSERQQFLNEECGALSE
jgi:WD40 repeat protein/serine/threonine protein kinase